MKDQMNDDVRVRYEVWLNSISLRHYFSLIFDRFIALLQKQVFLAVVLIISALSFKYYISGLDHEMEAVASTVASITSAEDIVKALTQSVGFRNDSESANDAESRKAESTKQAEPDPKMVASIQESALEHAQKHLDPNYICPIHSDVVSNDPNATCPICGMDLVLMDKNSAEGDMVTLTPRMINMLGVRTDTVKKRTHYRRINSVGYIKFDEDRHSSIKLRTEGWVEQLAVKAVGDTVRKGQLLIELYSPKLVNTQEELLQAMEMKNATLLDAARERLKALGVSESQIDTLEQTKQVQQLVKVYAPQDGVVSELNIREGMFVPPSKPIASIESMASVWLVANVFESQSDWVKEGQRAEAKLPFMPDKVWQGTVEHIYPSLDPKTRSLEVRIRLDNPGQVLKPNMYADVTIYAEPKRKVLTVPRDSIISTGGSERVILAMGKGRFKPVTIRTGIETNDRVEVIDGLKEGDEIVLSSQFLIDSESSLRASILRMGGS